MQQRLLDKAFLFVCTLVLYYFSFLKQRWEFLIPVAVVAFLIMIDTIFQNVYLHLAIFLIYLGCSCFFPILTVFLPVLVYEVMYTVFRWSTMFCILPFIFFWDTFSPVVVLFSALFFITSLFLYYKTSAIELLKNDYMAYRKTSLELAQVQEEKNQQILENQNYEIQTATLNERNRISKEIHDHVGHLLSRSLIQIGALLTISKEDAVREGLTDLKSSISEGMDSIRASIHNMHDESIDLNQSIQTLVKNFTLAPIAYEYKLHFTPPLSLKYCFIAITKESLANMEKHGKDITDVSISLTEDDSEYFLDIKDNGTVSEKTTRMVQRCQSRSEYTEGLGLQSMSDRVRGFHGTFTIDTAEGFHIKITIPKEKKLDESVVN